MMKVFVTGGGGFLGSHICRKLIERGDKVVAFQRSENTELKRLGVEIIPGSILDRKAIVYAANGCDAIIHTAAKAGVWGSRDSFLKTNLEGTRNLYRVAQDLRIGYFVHTSTPSVVFSGESFRGANEDLPIGKNWLCDYAESKALAEVEILSQDSDQFSVCALRPHLIWGKGDPHLVPALIEAGEKGRLRIIGDGKNEVDMTHVENAANAHLLALDALVQGKGKGKAYFISDGEPVNLWCWVNSLFELNGIRPITKSISLKSAYRMGGILEFVWKLFGIEKPPPMTRFVAVELAKDHWFNIERARSDLGYEPDRFEQSSAL